MRRVLKYPLGHSTQLSLPDGWWVVRVALQNGLPFVWIEREREGEEHPVSLEVFATGQDIPECARWLGTWEDGPFIWHLYEVPGG